MLASFGHWDNPNEGSDRVLVVISAGDGTIVTDMEGTMVSADEDLIACFQ